MSDRNSYIFGMVRLCVTALFAIAALTACVSEQDEALYRQSMTMLQKGNKEAAYKNINRLCTEFPSDKRFCAEEEALKEELYNENMTFVRSKLGQSVVSVSELSVSEERLNKAELYSNGTPEISKYRTLLAGHKQKTSEAVESAKLAIAHNAENGDYFSAYKAASEAKELDSALFGPIADEYGAKFISMGISEVEKMIAEDNLREAKELLSKMILISPENPKVKKYVQLVEKNDTAEYYMSKGDEAIEIDEPQHALAYYKKALAFPDMRQQAQRAIDNARMQIVRYGFMQGAELASQDLNYQAYDSFKSAFSTMKDIPFDLRIKISIPKEELKDYYDNLFYLGQKAYDETSFGQAYLYFTMLYDLSPSYLGLRDIRKSAEENILDRSMKKLELHQFRSPENDPEAGLRVTSAIMQMLMRSTGDDVKIIESAVADKADEQPADDIAVEANGADFLLMGEVLDSKIETNIQNSKKKVRVKVSENKVRNIEWDDWNREAEKLKAKNQPVTTPEPEKYIMQPVYDYADYDVAFHEKTSYLSVNYRVVEVSDGEVVYGNTVRAQKEARDESTSGIDLGSYKVEMKVANLPTDVEMSNDVLSEAAKKISSQIKDLFKDQDEKYLSEAEALESSDNLKEAVEMYANAILLKEKKGKDVSELMDKASKYLDVLSTY